MDDPELEQRILDFLRKELCWQKLAINADILKGSEGLYGSDVTDVLEKFGKQFNVNVNGYRWYHHTRPEGGCNPFWMFFRPWWSKTTYFPIRPIDFVESARAGHWTISYPEGEVR